MSVGDEGLLLDSRYKPAGLKGINQYDLEKASGVLQILESYWHYTYTVFPGSSVKKRVEYDMYARPTIDWDLQCELDGKTRESTDNFNLKMYSTGPDSKNKGFAIVALCMQLSMPAGGGHAAAVGAVLAVPFTFGFLMRPTLKFREWRNALRQDISNVDEVAWFNTCLDEQS